MARHGSTCAADTEHLKPGVYSIARRAKKAVFMLNRSNSERSSNCSGGFERGQGCRLTTTVAASKPEPRAASSATALRAGFALMA
jgi:hypothetical protein